jgi:hypothetical protein
MYIVPHTIVGISITKPLGRARGWLAFILAWASHYVLDALPHVEVSTFMPTDSELNTATKTELIIFGIDLAIFVIIFLLLKKFGWWRSWYWWGVIGAMIPDILDNIPGVNTWLRHYHPFDWLHQFHQWAHINMSASIWVWGVIIPFVVMGLASWYFFLSGTKSK